MKKLFLIIAMLCSNAFALVEQLKIGKMQIFSADYTLNNGVYTFTHRDPPGIIGVSYATAGFRQAFNDMGTKNDFNLKLLKMSGDNKYSLVFVDSAGRIVNNYASYGVSSTAAAGYIVGMADGLIHFRTTNSNMNIFIYPNNSFGWGDCPVPEKFGNAFVPTQAQLDSYIPPPPNQPLHTQDKSVPLGMGIAGGGGPAITGITAAQTTQLTAARKKITDATNGNKVYLEEKTGTSGSTVTIEQSGQSNTIGGIGAESAVINGTNNTISIKQGSLLGKNMIEFSVTGNTNNLNIMQARAIDGTELATDSGGHYAAISITGSNNIISTKQSNAGGVSAGHFESITVTGNSNSISLTQTGNGEKQLWGAVNGDNNIFNVTQQDAGSKYLDISLKGNGHNVTVNQAGSGAHKATISLTNAGGSSTLNLTQQGATAQAYSISQTCTNVAGCSVTYVQGN